MPTSLFARVAFLVLSIFWTASGWYFLLAGQLQHCVARCHSIITIDGPFVWMVALLFFALGLIAALICIRSFSQHLILQVSIAIGIFGLPLLYLLFR